MWAAEHPGTGSKADGTVKGAAEAVGSRDHQPGSTSETPLAERYTSKALEKRDRI